MKKPVLLVTRCGCRRHITWEEPLPDRIQIPIVSCGGFGGRVFQRRSAYTPDGATLYVEAQTLEAPEHDPFEESENQ